MQGLGFKAKPTCIYVKPHPASLMPMPMSFQPTHMALRPTMVLFAKSTTLGMSLWIGPPFL